RLGGRGPPELGVPHQSAAPDVREEPPVLVPRPHVQLEPHVPAAHEAPVQRGRLATSWFFTPDRVMDLRRVDADVANPLHVPAALDVNGVAIDDVYDGAVVRLGRRRRRED